jgi:hypothetical protein
MRSQGPSARAVSCVMVCPAAERPAEAPTSLEPRCQMEARITGRSGCPKPFPPASGAVTWEAWVTAATDRGLGALARVARGWREDLAAVTAGLTLPWSHGPVAGQSPRLKLLTRQREGHVGVTLPPPCVLQAAQSPAGDGPPGRGHPERPRTRASVGVCGRPRAGGRTLVKLRLALANPDRKGPTLMHQKQR